MRIPVLTLRIHLSPEKEKHKNPHKFQILYNFIPKTKSSEALHSTRFSSSYLRLSLVTFDFLDVLGAEEQHAVLESTHQT